MSHEKTEKKINVNVPVAMGKEYELKIERMGSSAEGVSHVDGFAVFVKGALAGEVVVGKITLVKKNYAVADVKKWVRKSADRVEPKCEIYYECGGCQMQHVSYEAQLRIKRQQVVDAIEHIGKQKNVEVLSTIGAENPWNYR
ncbi:MAG: TRAM domain-containing protein, partial [Selenomonadaceae bacterium]